MNNPTVLFFGYGSEYSLKPLHDFMVDSGDSCVEIDMLDHEDTLSALTSLSEKNIIFATSAHLLYDQRNFSYYKTERRIFSPLQIISTLNPVISIYYPHDYKDPIKDEEIAYLALFDLLLWPFHEVPEKYDALVKSQSVGWIKNTNGFGELECNRVKNSVVFFLGAYQYYLNLGADIFYRDFKELFDAGVSVKLPRWHENGPFETYLSQRGVSVHSSDANSVEIMKSHDVIITHALSSVAVEACHLGKKVVYIMDRRFDYKSPTAELETAGRICFIDSVGTLKNVDSNALMNNSSIMQQFDFNISRDAIYSLYKQKTFK